MTPAVCERLIARWGEACWIARRGIAPIAAVAGETLVVADDVAETYSERDGTVLPVRGVLRDWRGETLRGAEMQGERSLILSDAEMRARGWPGPPRRDDEVLLSRGGALQALAVDEVETRRIRDGVAMHRLVLRGN